MQAGILRTYHQKNERFSSGANIPVTIHLSNNQSYDGSLNLNSPDMSREQGVLLPQVPQHEPESIPVSNQPFIMSGIGATEQTQGESTQTAIESSNSTILTQSNVASTFSSKEIAIAEIISQLTSNQNISGVQNNVVSQQSSTTTSAHTAEGNSSLSERSGLELAQVNAVNEAQRWNPTFPGKNKMLIS